MKPRIIHSGHLVEGTLSPEALVVALGVGRKIYGPVVQDVDVLRGRNMIDVEVGVSGV